MRYTHSGGSLAVFWVYQLKDLAVWIVSRLLLKHVLMVTWQLKLDLCSLILPCELSVQHERCLVLCLQLVRILFTSHSGLSIAGGAQSVNPRHEYGNYIRSSMCLWKLSNLSSNRRTTLTKRIYGQQTHLRKLVLKPNRNIFVSNHLLAEQLLLHMLMS